MMCAKSKLLIIRGCIDENVLSVSEPGLAQRSGIPCFFRKAGGSTPQLAEHTFSENWARVLYSRS